MSARIPGSIRYVKACTYVQTALRTNTGGQVDPRPHIAPYMHMYLELGKIQF